MSDRMRDSAARAALWQAWCQHGSHAWVPTKRNPHAAQYAHALLRGWLWEPREGALAITPTGMAELAGYMPRCPDRTDTPAEVLP